MEKLMQDHKKEKAKFKEECEVLKEQNLRL
jgi:hypothetical protein